MYKKKISWPVLFLLSFLCLPLTARASAINNVILDGVYADGLNLSGLTEEEANESLSAYMEELKNADIKLDCVDGNIIKVKASELGLKWENPFLAGEAASLGKSGSLIKRYKDLSDLRKDKKIYDIKLDVDDAKVEDILRNKCSSFNIAAKNAQLKTGSNGGLIVEEGTAGKAVNVDASKAAIRQYVQTLLDNGENEISLVVENVQPRGDSEMLSRMTDKLGTYTTAYPKSSSDRCANIAAGCSHINGTILYPGEQFSAYAAVSPFTEENGYHLAGSYMNGLVVESLGGGICQVSSTLYQAVLRAELKVDQRSNHSMLVDYVPHSGDAAIAGTTKDFKFTNNKDTPIYISGSTAGKEITFTIYGVEDRPSNRTLAFESVDLETVEPEGEKVVGDSSQPAGYTRTQSAHTGYRAEYWKIIKVDGTEQSRERVNSSYYQATPRTLTVGTATENDVTKAAIKAAIATQSIDYCKAVAASVAIDGGAKALAEQQAVAAGTAPAPLALPDPATAATAAAAAA
ncbi:MAG: VanW family protein, partial [Lachnospiraceae bacterium]|nr:VanW family protein [Lachnospiraceae bacterium]